MLIPKPIIKYHLFFNALKIELASVKKSDTNESKTKIDLH